MWVVKVDMNGTLIWGKALGSTQTETGTGICPAHEGGYIVYGYTSPAGGIFDSTIAHIGNQDCWLFALDNSGNVMTDKIFGGVDLDGSASVIPNLNSYATSGISASTVFTEGTCNINYSGAFISYLEYWPLAVTNTNGFIGDDILVYPDPASDKVNITTSRSGTWTIMITDMMGSLVYRTSFDNKVQIPVKDWQRGIYCVQMIGENGDTQVTKLIVQ